MLTFDLRYAINYLILSQVTVFLQLSVQTTLTDTIYMYYASGMMVFTQNIQYSMCNNTNLMTENYAVSFSMSQ